MMKDAELLREYVESHSDSAFAGLVGRHVNLVYSTALRTVREPTLAEDVVQSVFVQLARKASTIRDGNALPGWLYRVTHCQAANALRAEQTRRRYEAEAMMQAQVEIDPAWERIGSGLDQAMSTLNRAEQDLMVMRFFQDRSWRDVGAALALSEDTVQRRAVRALEKLRAYFARQGVGVSASVIGMAVAANAVQAAPAGLASTVAGASPAGAAGASSFNLFTTIKILLMKKSTCAILSVAMVAAVSVPLIVATAGTDNQAVTAESLGKGLILHFTFDRDETGGKVTDSSGLGNHGKASGVRWTANGKNGGAYEFSADGDEIQVPDNVSLNPEQLTLAAWIKTSVTDDKWRRIFDKSYSKGYALSIAADWQGNKWSGLACLEIGPGTHLSLSRVKVADGQWHHVLATCDGVEQVLYVDGKAQGRPLRWTPEGRPGITTFNLVIGCNRSNLTEDDLGSSFHGLIDEPMVWKRALSPAEVAFLYQSQK